MSTRFHAYATRWDDGSIVEEIPARGLSFDLPVSAHGEAFFTATVEPGSAWRAALSPPVSGVLITKDTLPVWDGWLVSDEQSGPRTFTFRAREWGSFYGAVPAVAHAYSDVNDHAIIRDVFARAHAVYGQDVGLIIPDSSGAVSSDLTINQWDHNLTVEQVLVDLGNTARGPEWYVQAAGTLEHPTRTLVLGDRLGATDPTVLEYVEQTADPDRRGAVVVTLIDGLFPAATTVLPLDRRGGNVLAVSRVRDGSRTATATIAVGAGSEGATITAVAQSSRLIAAGFPRLTRTSTYSDVVRLATLQRHADGDLAASCGVLTGYQAVTGDGLPDWTQVPRGSTVQLILDTDVYGGARPVDVTSRVQRMTVHVPDDGGAAQVTWDIPDVLEV